MSVLIIPIVSIMAGAVLNWKGLPRPVVKAFDWIMNIALVLMMMVIGLNIGTSDTVMNNLGRIGINALGISLVAIAMSVIFVLILEKTFIHLDQLKDLSDETLDVDTSKSSFSPLVVLMPGAIALGIILGYFVIPGISHDFIDQALNVALILLYVSVGVTIADNKSVFGYVKKLGYKILFIPIAIFAGCFVGGVVSGWIFDVPVNISLISATGMGYYSMTGAYMTEAMGVEAGTYGFIVNVSRDVFTVLLIPLLSKISKGAPNASGAGGCMDTMLVPVTKAIGIELSMIAFLVGTLVTLIIPIWLPIAIMIFG